MLGKAMLLGGMVFHARHKIRQLPPVAVAAAGPVYKIQAVLSEQSEAILVLNLTAGSERFEDQRSRSQVSNQGQNLF